MRTKGSYCSSIAMIDFSPKKRDRPEEDDDFPEAMQPNKKLLVDSFTSLKIGEGEGYTYEPGTVTECITSDTSDMETDTMPTTVVCLPPSRTSNGVSLQSEDSENLYSMLKNGTRKYGRRVDYLVDELIKKSQRTCMSTASSADFDIEAVVPSSIGPHPLTDRPLGKLWPTVVPTVKGASMMKCNESSRFGSENGQYLKSRNSRESSSSDSDDDSEMEEDNCTNYDQNQFGMEEVVNGCAKVNVASDSPFIEQSSSSNNSNHAHHAGTITHSDWGIEDVT